MSHKAPNRGTTMSGAHNSGAPSSLGNYSAEVSYLIKKYQQLGLVDEEGERLNHGLSFDFNKYPLDDVIEQCRVCKNVFDTFKKDPTMKEIQAPHSSCGCLWWDFFAEKIKTKNPGIKFNQK